MSGVAAILGREGVIMAASILERIFLGRDGIERAKRAERRIREAHRDRAVIRITAEKTRRVLREATASATRDAHKLSEIVPVSVSVPPEMVEDDDDRSSDPGQPHAEPAHG